MPTPNEFTPAQTEAIQKAYAMLGEHFEASVIVVETAVPAEDPADGSDDCMTYWTINGGRSRVIGMMERCKARLLE